LSYAADRHTDAQTDVDDHYTHTNIMVNLSKPYKCKSKRRQSRNLLSS